MSKSDTLKLKAVAGRTVPLEDGSPWPTRKTEKGEVPETITVPRTRYWRRRVADGDVIDLNAQKQQETGVADAASKAAKPKNQKQD